LKTLEISRIQNHCLNEIAKEKILITPMGDNPVGEKGKKLGYNTMACQLEGDLFF
jgi:hypothetical protein